MKRIIPITLALGGLYASALLLAKGLVAVGFLQHHMTISEQGFVNAFFGAGALGGLISWLMSPSIADWSVNARPYAEEDTAHPAGDLRPMLAELAPAFGLAHVPELRIYDSAAVNAFAVGSRRRARVYVTSTLFERLAPDRAEAVIAHQLAKVASGDVPALLLMHGIVNVFTVFPTRMFSLLLGTSLRTAEEDTPADGIENGMKDLFELLLVPFTGLVTRQFARAMEARADAQAARVVGHAAMTALLSHFEEAQALGATLAPATREMFTAPLTFTARVRKALRLVSYHNPLSLRAAVLAQTSSAAANSTRSKAIASS